MLTFHWLLLTFYGLLLTFYRLLLTFYGLQLALYWLATHFYWVLLTLYWLYWLLLAQVWNYHWPTDPATWVGSRDDSASKNIAQCSEASLIWTHWCLNELIGTHVCSFLLIKINLKSYLRSGLSSLITRVRKVWEPSLFKFVKLILSDLWYNLCLITRLLFGFPSDSFSIFQTQPKATNNKRAMPTFEA